tara:strand:- start:21523 stop:21813 length:291 start_codon:yes stop_codon:yes gene_type:complete
MSEKVYFGNAKEVNFLAGGSLIRISFNLEDLRKMKENLNEAGYINLNCQERLTPSQYGHTHSVVLDTWKPQTQGTPSFQQPAMPSTTPEPSEDLPF